MTKEYIKIEGAGKGGGGGHTPVEYPDTLSATQTALVLGALCEGPIESIDEVYFDDTPISSYKGAKWKWRAGESSQTYINGFSNTEAVTQIGVELRKGVSIARDVSSATVDAVGITVQLNSLFHVEDDGDMVGYGVSFQIHTRVNASSPWVPWNNGKNGKVRISGKTMSAYPCCWEVNKPGGGINDIWGWQITRLTGNDPTSKYQSVSMLSLVNEIDYKKHTYNNTALLAIEASAKSTGGKTPRVSADVHAQKVFVPNNYNPKTRTYSGTWNGGMSSGRLYCNNPAWVVYDILTSTRFGMGISPSRIDLYSFYNAAVYNDGLVTYYDQDKAVNVTEPRFSFNGVLQTWEDDWQFVQVIAATFHSAIVDIGGYITCFQDRPTPITAIFNNTNVIDGMFEYASNSIQERHTVCNITYNDPDDRFKQQIATEEASQAYFDKYGYNSTEIAVLGCTSEGQARRSAKWLLETELSNSEQVVFRVGLADAYLRPSQVVGILDEYYAGTSQGGRISAATTTSVTFDRTITLPAGISKISCLLADGITLQEREVAQASGSFSSVTVLTPFSQVPIIGSPWIISTPTIEVRPFRIDKITLLNSEDKHTLEVQATFYDENKWSRVEGGVIKPAKNFANLNYATCSAPINPVVEIAGVSPVGSTESYNNLILSWSSGDAINQYTFKVAYTYENDSMIELDNLLVPNTTIQYAKNGLYTFWVYARNPGNVMSPVMYYQYLLGSTNQPEPPPPGINNSTLLPVTNLYVKGTTSNQFNTLDCVISWTDPNPVGGRGLPTLKQYRIDIYDAPGTSLKKTYVSAVPEFVYDFNTNRSDFGGNSARSFQVRVYAIDTTDKPSAATSNTFSNPAPGQQSVQIISGIDVVSFNFTTAQENDHKGYVIHRDTVPTFTPSTANNIYIGADSAVMLRANQGTTYHYKVAAYDHFGQTGLNYSAAITSTTASSTNYNFTFSGLTFTPNKTNNTVSWTTGMASVLYNEVVSNYNIAAGSATWSGGTGYIYYKSGESQLRYTTDLLIANKAGQIIVAVYKGGADLQVGNGKPIIDGSTILAGSIAAAQLKTDEAIITGTAQIANAIITNVHVQNGAIDNAKIGNVIQSTNFIPNTAGWKLDKNGGLEINGGNFTLRDNQGNVVLAASGQARGITGGNLLKNANFAATIRATKMMFKPAPRDWVAGMTNGSRGEVWVDTDWGPGGESTATIISGTSDMTNWSYFYQDVPIEQLRWYEFSCYTGAHRCNVFIQIQWLNLDRTSIVSSVSSAGNNATHAFWRVLDNANRLFTAGESPAGAYWARVVLYKGPTYANNADSYAFFSRALFARCNRGQTTPSEWQISGGLTGVGGIDGSNISTFIEDAAIGSAQIADLSVGRLKIIDRSVTDIQSATTNYYLPNPQEAYGNNMLIQEMLWQCPADAPYKVLFMYNTLSGFTEYGTNLAGTWGSSARIWGKCTHRLQASDNGGASWAVVAEWYKRTDDIMIANQSASANEMSGPHLTINYSMIPTPNRLYRMTTLLQRNRAIIKLGLANGTTTITPYCKIFNDVTTHIAIPYWK
jgi:predicted phage tail protein